VGEIMTLKQKIYNLIRDDDENDLLSTIIDYSLIGLILINVILVIVDTFPMPDYYYPIAQGIEFFSVMVFTIEYGLRLWTSTLMFPTLSKTKARVKYASKFMAIVDLLAILPFYLPFIFPVDLRVLRMLRMLRLLRLFKVSRYTDSIKTIANVFKNRAPQLISSTLIVFLLMVIASVVMFNLENEVQPDVFENAFSGMWWAVATFTTVGYGDIFPITAGGRLVAGLISMLGIGLVAVPTGIISAGFIEQITLDKNKEETPVENNDQISKIKEAKKLLDDKLINENQYESMVNKIIEK
jgi:voltage-gated potassium channel